MLKYGSVQNQELKESVRQQENEAIKDIANTEEYLAKTIYSPMGGIYDSMSIVAEEATEANEHMTVIMDNLNKLWSNMRAKDNVAFRKNIASTEQEAFFAIEELFQLIAVCRKSLDAVPTENYK